MPFGDVRLQRLDLGEKEVGRVVEYRCCTLMLFQLGLGNYLLKNQWAAGNKNLAQIFSRKLIQQVANLKATKDG